MHSLCASFGSMQLSRRNLAFRANVASVQPLAGEAQAGAILPAAMPLHAVPPSSRCYIVLLQLGPAAASSRQQHSPWRLSRTPSSGKERQRNLA